MSQYRKLEKIMEKRLKKSRFVHTQGVVATAVKLAKIHGTDEKSAALAALLHDYGKHLKRDELLRYAKEFGISLNEVTKNSVSLLHGEVGAELVCKELDICDEDILNAIRYHTYGRVGMSQLEKIIYIADAIEPGRDYPGVETLRKLAQKDLDGALKKSISDSIQFVVKKGHALHYNTIELWNELITNNKR